MAATQRCTFSPHVWRRSDRERRMDGWKEGRKRRKEKKEGEREKKKEVLDLARQQNKRVKAIGGGHSPSDIACTDGFMIHMGKMNRILKVDKEKHQITVEGGILLKDLNVELSKHGLALPNLGAVSDVTAAGVIGTGTHNTGIKHGILPTQVLDNLDSHLRKSEYFRFLWFPHSENVSVIYQDHTNKPPTSAANWFWDYAIGFHLLEFLLWVSTFLPRLVHWINRFFFWLLFTSKVESSDISYKILNYECRFKQYVQDWAIPIEKTAEALLELKAMLESNPHVVAHFPVEVRFVKGDDILLSPCFQKDSCYMNIIMYRKCSYKFSDEHSFLDRCFHYQTEMIHIVLKHLTGPYGKDVPRLDYWLAYERIMKKVGGRPHWAKAHTCTRKDFEKMYPSFQKFCAIREKLDPTGMFLNAYLEKVFY
ncbi:L-gulonolactone oxidase isoform X5 [Notamacropus eugenii]|uniref:L-gulonolactone oxidase isoform X5 n=1 Tax=Notamacropus eugenii TaxID=9315 RepID=UPI003B66C051